LKKTLFSYLVVGLAFTVLQVSISQAQVMSSEEERKGQIQGGQASDKMRDGQGRIRNKMTHGAKQGRNVPGTKTSGNYADEESKAGEHQNAHEKQTKEQRERKIKACVADMNGGAGAAKEEAALRWCTAKHWEPSAAFGKDNN
jgi:hypothetical protein